MTIRKELAEKKLGNVNKDYELTIEKLQRKLDEAQNNLKKKEKEFEDTLHHLQTDIDSLENEKTKMKEILKVYKKTLSEGNMDLGNQMNSMPSIGPSLPAVVKDSPLLLQEIENLRKLFHSERSERLKLQTDKLKHQLDDLVPLPSFRNEQDVVLESLFKEGAKLKKDILNTLAKPEFPPVCKAKPGNGGNAWIKHFAEEKDKMLNLRHRAEEFWSKVANEVMRRKHGGFVEADFTVFPTLEMTKALNEIEPIDIGFLQIPRKYLSKEDKSGTVSLDVSLKNLQNLIEKVSS